MAELGWVGVGTVLVVGQHAATRGATPPQADGCPPATGHDRRRGWGGGGWGCALLELQEDVIELGHCLSRVAG